jgi:hypothetical protein
MKNKKIQELSIKKFIFAALVASGISSGSAQAGWNIFSSSAYSKLSKKAAKEAGEALAQKAAQGATEKVLQETSQTIANQGAKLNLDKATTGLQKALNKSREFKLKKAQEKLKNLSNSENLKGAFGKKFKPEKLDKLDEVAKKEFLAARELKLKNKILKLEQEVKPEEATALLKKMNYKDNKALLQRLSDAGDNLDNIDANDFKALNKLTNPKGLSTAKKVALGGAGFFGIGAMGDDQDAQAASNIQAAMDTGTFDPNNAPWATRPYLASMAPSGQ